MINQCHTADDTYFHTHVIWLPNKVDRVLDNVGLSDISAIITFISNRKYVVTPHWLFQKASLEVCAAISAIHKVP